MISTETKSPTQLRTTWKLVAIAVVGWLAGCALAGFVLAAASGEHGSIVIAGFGVFLGLAGAGAHTALLFMRRFRVLPLPKQVFFLWLATLATLLTLAIVFGFDSNSPDSFLPREALTIVSLYVAAPALAASFLLGWLVNRAAARSPNT